MAAYPTGRARRHAVAAVLLAAATLTTISAQDARAGAVARAAVPAKVVAVALWNGRVTLSPSVVQQGTIVFNVVNKGSLQRDFRIGGTRTRLLKHGARQALRVALPRAGSYAWTSTVPGRRLSLRKGSVRTQAPAPVIAGKLRLTLVGDTFAAPTEVVAPPGDPSRLIVVEQNGLAVLVKDGAIRSTPFLDLRAFVRADGEKGLLSLAFAPDYAASGLLYAYYNNRDGNIRVVELQRSAADPDVVDITSRRRVLAITKQTADHNGGMMEFGPDGYLYIGIGDGGANPPAIPVGATGQTLDDLLGSILRIDPRHGSPYAIPAGNPFAATAGARPEIVAYGLRNPWRFWIDPITGTMAIGDVGEGESEEIDVLPLDRLGLDFGWPCKEGTTVPPDAPLPAACGSARLTPPALDYPHGESRCSIIGGVVARDPGIPVLDGLYLWTDFCDGRLYASDLAAGAPATVSLGVEVAQPVSFGADAAGRVYVATEGGALYRIDAA